MRSGTLITAVINRINYFLGIRNMSQYALAEKSGVPYPTIKSIMQQRTSGISLKTLIMLSAGLNVSASEFLDDKTFAPNNLDLD